MELLEMRRKISRRCRLVVPMVGTTFGRLVEYATNAVEFVEPNKFECGFSCLVFGFGMSPEMLGVDPSAYVGVWPPIRQRYQDLQKILSSSTGAGRACCLVHTNLQARYPHPWLEEFVPKDWTGWLHPLQRREEDVLGRRYVLPSFRPAAAVRYRFRPRRLFDF